MEWNIEVKDIFTSESNFYSIKKNKVTIGRSEDNDITINNQYISSKHLTLSYRNDCLYAKDENTSNGSEINIDFIWQEIKREKKAELPIQLKLAKAVIVVVQPKESQLISLKEVERKESILVLDLCDSTKLAFKDDKMAFHLKKRLSAIARPILFKQDLLYFKSTGDGFLATFPTALNALDAAQKIMQSINTRNQKSDHPPIHVRIALHYGKTYLIDPVSDDIHGSDINITFRLEGIKKGAFSKFLVKLPKADRILCTKPFYDELDNKLKRKQNRFYCLGPVKMRGVEGKIEVFRFDWC